MEKHELSCTMNPNRVCRMCKMAGLTQKPIAELIALLPEDGCPGGPIGDEKAIREATGGCPACLMAANRQSDSSHVWCVVSWEIESKAWLDKYRKDDRYFHDY